MIYTESSNLKYTGLIDMLVMEEVTNMPEVAKLGK